MRITGGSARGIPLKVPAGDAVRPATDALRQAVFSSLGGRVAGARFLDLFAGAGGYGLEAVSRGAASGVFVEKSAKAAGCLRGNLAAVLKSMRGVGEWEVREMDALTTPLPVPAPDLVFADPPYDLIEEAAPKVFDRLAEAARVRADLIVIFELPGEVNLQPPGWKLFKRLGKGSRQPTAAFFRPDVQVTIP